MGLHKIAVISVMAVGLACGAAGRAAHADICDHLTGVAQAAGAVDRIQQTVFGVIDRASVLLERTNFLISARLDQAREIVALAVGGAKAVEEKAYGDLMKLETRTVSDIGRLIQQVK
ncbi:MAG TPA: hypothetical protein VH722_14040 [Alphaproteobacteria bacterium]|jgi:hypothetical protein|nr:hypothetical protein [Alphaproteobacteria bacterium]